MLDRNELRSCNHDSSSTAGTRTIDVGPLRGPAAEEKKTLDVGPIRGSPADGRKLGAFGASWTEGVDHLVTDAAKEDCLEDYGVYGIRITPQLKRHVPECWPTCAYGQ